jgi:hypothetical protein
VYESRNTIVSVAIANVMLGRAPVWFILNLFFCRAWVALHIGTVRYRRHFED